MADLLQLFQRLFHREAAPLLGFSVSPACACVRVNPPFLESLLHVVRERNTCNRVTARLPAVTGAETRETRSRARPSPSPLSIQKEKGMSESSRPKAQQGHRYAVTDGIHAGWEVLALSSGPRPRVAPMLAAAWPYLGFPFDIDAEQLQPLPMTYFHGQTPAMG